jgi:hypothetical protein
MSPVKILKCSAGKIFNLEALKALFKIDSKSTGRRTTTKIKRL